MNGYDKSRVDSNLCEIIFVGIAVTSTIHWIISIDWTDSMIVRRLYIERFRSPLLSENLFFYRYSEFLSLLHYQSIFVNN